MGSHVILMTFATHLSASTECDVILMTFARYVSASSGLVRFVSVVNRLNLDLEGILPSD